MRIAGHPAALLGPHHVQGIAGRWTWERPWEPAPTVIPPGDSWISSAAGLSAPPVIAIATTSSWNR